ncbi:MAG: DUF1624 domain-containing protein [Bacteroidales bacterium]|nr:DUF1624 domain-containing protein [Bacteroidales bacterium]
MEHYRSRTSDLIKGVAIIAMVQVVLLELFARQPIVDGLIGKISLFIGGSTTAPVFLSVMGYYIAYKHKSFKKKVLRGLELIGLGFLLNIGRNILVLTGLAHPEYAQAAIPLIFSTDILILAGLSLIAIAVIIQLFRGHVLIFLFLIVVILLLQYVIPPVENTFPNSILLPFLYGKYPNGFFPLIPWLSYVLAGYCFYQFKNYFVSDQFKHSQTVKVMLLFLSGIVLIVTAKFGFRVSVEPKLYFHHGIMFFLFCINYVFWWLLSARAIVHRSDNFIAHYVEWLGKNVTAFYVIFMLLVGNLAILFYKILDYKELIGWFIGMLFVTSLLVFLWEKVRHPETDSGQQE